MGEFPIAPPNVRMLSHRNFTYGFSSSELMMVKKIDDPFIYPPLFDPSGYFYDPKANES
jgi:hypothetical protein